MKQFHFVSQSWDIVKFLVKAWNQQAAAFSEVHSPLGYWTFREWSGVLMEKMNWKLLVMVYFIIRAIGLVGLKCSIYGKYIRIFLSI